jgi:hypothetical protein
MSHSPARLAQTFESAWAFWAEHYGQRDGFLVVRAIGKHASSFATPSAQERERLIGLDESFVIYDCAIMGEPRTPLKRQAGPPPPPLALDCSANLYAVLTSSAR